MTIDAAQRICILRTDRLGETILTLPIAAALKHAKPTTHITMVVAPPLVALVREAPGVDVVLEAPPQTGQWWHHAFAVSHLLRPLKFDCVIVVNPQKSLHLAVWLAGIRWRVGYGRKWGGLLTHRIDDQKALGDRHEIEYNFDLIQWFGLHYPSSEFSWNLPICEPEHHQVQQFLQTRQASATHTVVVHPWTSNPHKQWPVASYRALLQQLTTDLSLRVCVIGGPEEAATAKALVADLPRAINLTGRLSVRELAEVLRQSTVLISNDSGPVHVASAVGCRVIALFGTDNGPQMSHRWKPWGSGHTVLEQARVEMISVEQVLHAFSAYITT